MWPQRVPATAPLSRSSSTNNASHRSSGASAGVMQREDSTGSAAPIAPDSARQRTTVSPLSAPRVGSRSPVATNLPRASSRSPHRRPDRTPFDIQSREGRLLSLIKDYGKLSLKPWGDRVHVITQRYGKLQFLSEEDLSFLFAAQARNASFMRTVEDILASAATNGEAVEPRVSGHALEIFEEAVRLNLQIRELLAIHSSRAGGRPSSSLLPPSPLRISSASPRLSCPRPRSSSPGGEGGRMGDSVAAAMRSSRVISLPTSFSDIRTPPRRPSSSPVRMPVTSTEQRRLLLEGIEELSKASRLLDDYDVGWLKDAFGKLYGPNDGPMRLKRWSVDKKIPWTRIGGDLPGETAQ